MRKRATRIPSRSRVTHLRKLQPPPLLARGWPYARLARRQTTVDRLAPLQGQLEPRVTLVTIERRRLQHPTTAREKRYWHMRMSVGPRAHRLPRTELRGSRHNWHVRATTQDGIVVVETNQEHPVGELLLVRVASSDLGL